MSNIFAPPRAACVHRLRATLALAVAAALCATGAIAAPVSMLSIAQPIRLHAGDAVVGALPMNQPIHVEVALKMRDRAGLDALIADNARKQAAHTAPQLLSADEFLAQHAPAQAQAQEVADYLAARGFTNIVVAPNRLLVSADGTVATARDAFATSFAQVRASDGRMAYANTDEARIPASLADSVQAVVGLQDVHRYHTFALRAASGQVHAEVMQGHAPAEFNYIYDNGLISHPSFNVGILSDGNLTSVLTDLDAYETLISQHGLFTYQVVKVNGGGSDTSHADEWALDSQVIAAMVGAGSYVKILFYDTPDLSAANVTSGLNAIVTANKAKVVVASVGECETDALADGSAAADDTLLAAAVAQGMTFSVPAGNAGADECGDGSDAPLWPASSRYVVAVGGTSLNGPTNTWSFEQVWQQTGGSPSTFESMPSWQTSFGVPGTKRGVPDIAYDGNPNSGSQTFVDSGFTAIGGTGLSASIFASMWAQYLIKWGGNSGFAAPVVYSMPAADFHDIVSGGNHGETAGTGYDFASGRGSIIIANGVNDARPLVANFNLNQTGPGSLSVIDTSIDRTGTINSHHWDFGDGTVATTASASHAYLTDGTYSVVDTVTDNHGLKDSLTKPFVVSIGQLIGNPGFETGGTFAPWYIHASGGQSITLDGNPADAFDGSHSANINYQRWSSLNQKVKLPAGKSSATLAFHLWIANGSLAADQTETLYVELAASDGAKAFATLATFTNNDASAGYVTHSYDMTPYIGQTLVVRFRGAANADTSRTGGYFRVDDVTLATQ
ncbi:MAG TPA: protease pro-enzyme activation domain-containing protein [Xanthomonadaceae bacterium]|jgi:subtilase family serine protease